MADSKTADIRDGEPKKTGAKEGVVSEKAHMESHVHNHVHNHVHHHGGTETKPGDGKPESVKKSPAAKMYDKPAVRKPMAANDGD